MRGGRKSVVQRDRRRGRVGLRRVDQSPLRDGGYDISDFRSVLPEFGTMADLLQLAEDVHRRGMRVIVDLVINHTSDQHPWFRAQNRTAV